MKHSLKSMVTGVALAVFVAPLFTTSAMAQDITIDLAGEPATMDPHKQWNPTSYYVYRNVFDNILTRDNGGTIIGQIATSWNQTSDSTLELTIREGGYLSRRRSVRAVGCGLFRQADHQQGLWFTTAGPVQQDR